MSANIFRVPAVYTVYVLICAETQKPFYVGVTKRPLRERLLAHIAGATRYNYPVSIFIKSMSTRPYIEAVHKFKAKNHHFALVEENYWIQKFSSLGFELMNSRNKDGSHRLHVSDIYSLPTEEKLKRIKSKKKI